MKSVLLSILLSFVTAQGQQVVGVGPNVQVSKLRPDWEHNEVILAADPNDANHLLSGSMFLDPAIGNYSTETYVSFDGGGSWEPTLTVGKRGGFYTDPAVAFGCDGQAYSVSLGNFKTEGKRNDDHTFVYRSKDGGKNWRPPVVLPFSDREYITVDCTNSKFRGRIYIHGAFGIKTIDGGGMSGIAIFTSIDDGQSFSQKVIAPIPGHESCCQGNAVVLSDGTFVAPFRDYDIGKDASFIRLLRSENGGETFSNAITISKIVGPTAPMSFAVDQSTGPFRDRIYGVWTDDRLGRSVIMLAYSSDKGKSWSTPIVVNDDQPFSDGRKGPDDYMGTVAVNRAGVVGVSWYDRRDSANNRNWYVRFAASRDGGRSFQPSVRVSKEPFKHDWSKVRVLEFQSLGGSDYESLNKMLDVSVHPSRSYFGGGDTAGLVTSPDGIFHPLWVDNRTGTPQVWTAPITVDQNALLKPTAKKPEDISQKVNFEFSEVKYDPNTKIISAKAYLVNLSDEVLKAPIVVRVIGFRPSGTEIMNADNGLTGIGAAWSFPLFSPENKIEPRKKTEGKLIQFRVPKLEPESPPSLDLNFSIESGQSVTRR